MISKSVSICWLTKISNFLHCLRNRAISWLICKQCDTYSNIKQKPTITFPSKNLNWKQFWGNRGIVSIFLWIRLSTYLELLCLLYNVIWRQNFHLFGVNQTLGKDKYRTYWCTVEKIPTKYLDHFVVHKIELSLKEKITQNKIPRHLSSINFFISQFI